MIESLQHFYLRDVRVRFLLYGLIVLLCTSYGVVNGVLLHRAEHQVSLEVIIATVVLSLVFLVGYGMRASHASRLVETVRISNSTVFVKGRKNRRTLEEVITSALLENRKWQYLIFLLIAFVLHQIAYETRKTLHRLLVGSQMIDQDFVHTG